MRFLKLFFATLAIAALSYGLHIMVLHVSPAAFLLCLPLTAICSVIYYKTIHRYRGRIFNLFFHGIFILTFELIHTNYLLYGAAPPTEGHYSPVIYILLVPVFILPFVLMIISAVAGKIANHRRKQ